MWGKLSFFKRPFGMWGLACSAHRRNSKSWDRTTHTTHPLLAETFAPPSTQGSLQLQIQLFDTYCPHLDAKQFCLKDPSFDFVENSRHRSGSFPGAVPTCAERQRPTAGAWARGVGGRESPFPQAFAPGSPRSREGPRPLLPPPPRPQSAGWLSPSRSRLSASLAAALGAAGTGRSGLRPRNVPPPLPPQSPTPDLQQPPRAHDALRH